MVDNITNKLIDYEKRKSIATNHFSPKKNTQVNRNRSNYFLRRGRNKERNKEKKRKERKEKKERKFTTNWNASDQLFRRRMNNAGTLKWKWLLSTNTIDI